MAGTFGGALEARQIRACNDLLVTRVTGEVELEEKVLVIRRIHVRFELKVAHAIAITSELAMLDPDAGAGTGAA
jgi:hypothetical protein